MPIRIQRRRTKGWKMPPNTIYVGRPTKWGNPLAEGSMITTESAGPHGEDITTTLSHDGAVIIYRAFYAWRIPKEKLEELRGKNLACWCPLMDENGKPVLCHADVLLEAANR